MKKIKWYWYFLLFTILFLIWGLSRTFLFSPDGWNKTEREINTDNILISIVNTKDVKMNLNWEAKVRGLLLNQENVSVDIFLDEDNKSFSGLLGRTWQENYENNFQYRGDVVVDNDNNIKKNIILYFEKKSCNGVDDYVYNYKTELNFNGEKTYIGCAKLTGETLQKMEQNTTKLITKEWFWTQTQYNDDTAIKPKKENIFSLKFDINNKVSIKTDCNSMFGNYSLDDKDISFKDIASTKMYCKDSQENEFSKMLGEVSSYMFTPKGELVLLLKFDSGSMIFK